MITTSEFQKLLKLPGVVLEVTSAVHLEVHRSIL